MLLHNKIALGYTVEYIDQKTNLQASKHAPILLTVLHVYF